MKKVLLVTEVLNPPYDEGIKKTVYNLFLEFIKKYNLLVICREGFQKDNIKTIHSNKLFFSASIKNQIKSFKPDTLLYFPYSSSTFASYLRFFILSRYNKNSRNVFFALQPKSLSAWQKVLVHFIKPQLALTPSPELHNFWNSLHIQNRLLPLLTDLKVFKPLYEDTIKKDLRIKYNLPANAFIISHMGHLNEGRNLKSLIPLQKSGNQIVIVGSSSTPKDSIGPASLKESLVKEGIIILDAYIEHIEEIYQLSDLYIFPVITKTGSIGMPLSIMEARACGIPVLTTNFGSLKHFLSSDNGNIYYTDPDNFIESIQKIKTDTKTNRNETIVNQMNDKFLELIHHTINHS